MEGGSCRWSSAVGTRWGMVCTYHEDDDRGRGEVGDEGGGEEDGGQG